jgi:hypothetical protein
MIMEWVQPKALNRTFELRAGGDHLATLAFRSSFGSLASADTADGSWTFKRVGFFNPRITVRAAMSETDLAVYQPKFWGDGVLAFRDGPSFSWKPANFWATEWVFKDEADNSILVFKSGIEKGKLSDMFKTQATVEVQPVLTPRQWLPLLAALGMYLLILRQEEAAAATAATAAAAS